MDLQQRCTRYLHRREGKCGESTSQLWPWRRVGKPVTYVYCNWGCLFAPEHGRIPLQLRTTVRRSWEVVWDTQKHLVSAGHVRLVDQAIAVILEVLFADDETAGRPATLQSTDSFPLPTPTKHRLRLLGKTLKVQEAYTTFLWLWLFFDGIRTCTQWRCFSHWAASRMAVVDLFGPYPVRWGGFSLDASDCCPNYGPIGKTCVR